jgi:hypothetical protein
MIRIVSMEPNHITPSLPKHPSVFPEDRLRSVLRNVFALQEDGRITVIRRDCAL